MSTANHTQRQQAANKNRIPQTGLNMKQKKKKKRKKEKKHNETRKKEKKGQKETSKKKASKKMDNAKYYYKIETMKLMDGWITNLAQ